MMTVLLESAGGRGPRRAGWTVASVSVHAALIVGAVVVTTQAPAIAPLLNDPPILVIPYQQLESAPARPSLPTGPVMPGAPSIPTIPIKIPTVPAFDVTRPFTKALAGTEVFDRPSGP